MAKYGQVSTPEEKRQSEEAKKLAKKAFSTLSDLFYEANQTIGDAKILMAKAIRTLSYASTSKRVPGRADELSRGINQVERDLRSLERQSNRLQSDL